MDVDGWKVTTIVSSLLTGVLGWLGKRHAEKVDQLVRDSVSRPELKEHLKDHLESITAARVEMHQENRRSFEVLGNSLLRLEGKLDAAEPAAMAGRLARAESDILSFKEWRNAKVDAELSEFKLLMQRVELLERANPNGGNHDRRRVR